MPYSVCAADVAASIQNSCSTPHTGGYTGRGFLIQIDQVPTITQDATNPRIVTNITMPTGKKVIAIDNVFAEPFAGSTTASNGDSGRIQHTKTFAFRIPARGAAVSKNIVEPLENNALGFYAVLEKKDRSGDGSYEFVGLQQGLKTNVDGVQRDEAANGGDISVTMSCVEQWFEASLFDTDYANTKTLFEELLAGAI